MKTTLLCLSFLLISISTCSLGASQPDPVLDVNGEMLQSGSSYYIISVIRGGGGGGVTLARTRNTSCPLDVVQEKLDVLRGLPWTFIPENPEEVVIREATDLNIKFAGLRSDLNCSKSTVWRVDNYEGENIVTTGGVAGDPGPETFSNWFRFEKTNTENPWYKIVFCPNVCPTCTRPICGDIGRSFTSAFRRLVLAPGAPFGVYFVKADTAII